MKHNPLGYLFGAGAGLLLSMAPQQAHAVPIAFTGALGNLAASVTFDVLGSNLQVVLTNTSAADVLVPADVLTGVYFSGTGALSSVSALLTFGSTVFYDPNGQPAGGVVGGEWAYGSGLVGAPGGATAALASTGAFDAIGQPTFPGANLAGPVSVNGLQYGLLSAGDDPTTGNAGVTGSGGLVRNSVTFTLGGLPDDFSLAGIGNVSFQYGTSLSEPIIPGNGGPNGGPPPVDTPEPLSLALLGTGLLGLGAIRMRRRPQS